MDKFKQFGIVIMVTGIVSFLLSFVGLELRMLSFLGENKRTAEIACVVIGILVLFVASRFKDKDEE